jgi:hypothetical protein
MAQHKKRWWLGPGRNPRGKGQMFEPVAFTSRRRANKVRKTGTSAGRVKREGGGSGGWILLLIVLAIIAALVLAGCGPHDAGRGKPAPAQTASPQAAPYVGASPGYGYVYITHRVHLEKTQRLTAPRNPAGLFERTFLRGTASPRTADIGATRNFYGALGCYIWYANGGKVWLISYDESAGAGGVACNMNDINFRTETKKPGRSIEDCTCTPGNDTVVMRVIWTPDGDTQLG